ncbi:general odorant-binding protein 99b [Bactrocera oleae]|uniref:general odorant-binding protein 99b n=1 Tax=Bactrocera oleae TaxID=104688 RepID=UPI0006B74CA1|nr:general odorant-binding protein 99b [Bactrocera oleae]
MKFCLALLSLLIAVVLAVADHHADHSDYVVKTNADLVRYRDECVSQLSIPSDLVDKYKQWSFPDDEKTHCYLKCVMEKFDVFDAEKGFDVHKIHHQLEGSNADHSDATHGAIENCAKEAAAAGDDACVRAYRGFTCFLKDNIKLVQAGVEKSSK